MAQNNLRIIYNNLADVSGNTVSVSSTASASMTAANLTKDYKSLVWRSAQASTTVAKTKAIILVSLANISVVSSVVLAYTNLKVGATVRVTGYTGSAPVITAGTVDVPAFTITGSTQQFDSGTIDVNKPALLGQFNWGFEELGPTGNELKQNYSVVWLPAALRIPVKYLVIEITNSDNIDQYIEVSRLIVGNHWSPQFNTSYGMEVSYKDTSSTERSEAGDLISINGVQYPTLTFDLAYLSIADRTEFNRMVNKRGRKLPLFISLFPENTDDPVKEQIYQIYGKLAQSPGISHPIMDMYSSQVEIEEI